MSWKIILFEMHQFHWAELEKERYKSMSRADLEVELVQLNHCDGVYSNYWNTLLRNLKLSPIHQLWAKFIVENGFYDTVMISFALSKHIIHFVRNLCALSQIPQSIWWCNTVKLLRKPFLIHLIAMRFLQCIMVAYRRCYVMILP